MPQINPGNDPASNKLLADIRQASQLLKNGQRSGALALYHEIAGRAGNSPGVQLQLGFLCEEIGDIDQAITHYVVAADEEPDNATTLGILGVACLNADDLRKAGEVLQRAHAIDPDSVKVNHGLGVYYMRQADHQRALEFLEHAVALKPGDASVRVNLATTMSRLDRHEDALTHIRKALKLDDSNPDAHLVYGGILAQTGDIEAAERHLEGALRKHPGNGGMYDQLARYKKFSQQDAGLIKKAEKALSRGMPPRERYGLLYALGKMHDDCGDYDQAFDYYEQANLLKKKPYDVDKDDRLRRAHAKTFSARFLDELRDRGHESRQPVFIVGMPRSGTTLMEQIIGGHPEGAGADELPAIPAISKELFGANKGFASADKVRAELTGEKIHELAERYLAILQQGRGSAARIVDKLPSNFLFLGVIKALFPNATIIHAIRHPLDSCLSCYFQNFTDLRWANDLEVISQIYGIYRKSMTNWENVLPEGSILNVRYEELVDDPETHARRMIEACGLEWDASVLEFFRKKSVVRTASIAQSRQAIYKTSKQRWMNYAKHLQPVVTGIAEYLEDDKGLLAQHGLELRSNAGWLKRMFG